MLNKPWRVTEKRLQRKSPLTASDLESIRHKLGLASHTEALEEAAAVLALIMTGKRRSFLIEEADGRVVRINL